MEEDEQSLTSEDIFGDIINQVQQSSSFEIELEEDKETEEESKEAKPEEIKEEPQPQMEQKKDEKKESDPKMEKKEEVEKEVEPEKTPDKPEETSEAPQPKKISETPKKPTSIITPGPHDITDTLLELKKVKKETKDDKKFKKLEDDITKKFESTLSGLGLDSKKRPIKKEKPPEPAAPKPIDAKYKERRRDEVGGYDILGLVARGGMAEIYKAKKKGVKGFEKIIAIKKILAGYGKDDKYIEMFVDEAKISAELSHPNIVPIYDLGKKDDYYFIAMEYVTGKDLRLILRKLEILDKQLPEEISIYTIMKVLDALDYAHNAKNSTGKKLDIVHRDISPPNILISFDGEVKLTDFGVSKASIKMHQTVAGALKGKLLYMSPEQASGDFNIDYRSDLFSVGIILFELITGEKLFMNPSEMAVLKKVQTGEIIKPSEMKKNIDSELERIILKLLEKDRGKRYQSASDTLKDLEKYILNQYDHMPTPTHISHTIFDLFKEEIMREGIKIELKTIPYSIKKIKKEEREKEKEPVELKQEEMIETKEEVKETPPEPAPPKKEKVEEKVEPLVSVDLEEEEFSPTFEISLEDEKKEKPKKAKKLKKLKIKKKKLEPKTEEVIVAEPKPEEEELKKKKKTLFISIAAVLVIAVFIILYLVMFKEKSPVDQNKQLASIKPKETQTPIQPVVTTETKILNTSDGIKTPDSETEAQTPSSEEQATLKKDQSPTTKTDSTKPAEKKPVTKKVEKQPDPTTKNTAQPKQTPSKKKAKPKATSTATKPKEEVKTPDETEKEKPTQQETTDEQQKLTEEQIKTQQLEKAKEEEKKRLEAEAEKNRIQEGALIPISDVDTAPVAVKVTPISLTRMLKRLVKVNQVVQISYLINHNGDVEQVKIIRKSAYKKLNELVEKTVLNWKYKPALKEGVKVKVWTTKLFKINK